MPQGVRVEIIPTPPALSGRTRVEIIDPGPGGVVSGPMVGTAAPSQTAAAVASAALLIALADEVKQLRKDVARALAILEALAGAEPEPQDDSPAVK